MFSGPTKDSETDKHSFAGLPDEVLLHILSYVNATTLYNISKLDSRLHTLVCTNRLWRYVDGRSRAPPKRSRKLATFCMQNVYDGTRTLLLAGRSRFRRLFPHCSWLLADPHYSKLTVLGLENQRLPSYVTLSLFPSGLHELSLRNSYSDKHEIFFKYSHGVMSQLRVLVLDGCRWVTSCMLVSVCKFPNLQILSMVRCTKMQDLDVYINMAANFGFPALRVMDARHTKCGDSMVSALLVHKPKLRSLYFASYSAAFYPDVIGQMKLHQREDDRLDCIGEELDYDERKQSQCRNIFGSTDPRRGGLAWRPLSYQDISDLSSINYARLRQDEINSDDSGDNEALYPSLLYRDPYSIPCKCKMPAIDRENGQQVDPMPDCRVGTLPNTKWVKSGDAIRHMRHRKRWRIHEMTTTFDIPPRLYDNRSYGFFDAGAGAAWEELLGDEYETCSRAYRKPAPAQSSPAPTTTSSGTSGVPTEHRKRKRRLNSDSNNTSSSSDWSSSSSSCDDSSSSGNDVQVPVRQRRLTKRRRRTRSPTPMHPVYIEVLPRRVDRGDASVNDDDQQVIRVQLRAPGHGDHAAGAPPEDGAQVPQGVYVVPAAELNRSIPTKLTHLSLRGFKRITDKTLYRLSHLQNMRVVDVTGTRVTQLGVEKFAEENPHCRLVHQSICTCIPIMHL